MLVRTIVKLYRTHWHLFWRIMIPVAIIAISLDIAQFFQIRELSEDHIGNTPSRRVYTSTTNINTISGIVPTIANTSSASRVDWGLSPLPHFRATDGEGTTWSWNIKFKSHEYGVLILLLLTLCPLTLAVARISRDAHVSESAAGLSAPTAREMWRQTGRKALTVFGAALLFLLIVNVGAYFNIFISWLVPSYLSEFPFELMYILTFVPYIYFIVTLSLYNPCLILEDNVIVGIFRRSHTLVSRARFRFFGLYLLTGWIAAVVTAVLFGVALLLLSIFIPELAPVRAALSPLKFLTLFIGADVEVVLPQVLTLPPTVAILILKGLIATFLVPIWAILTTLLYLEQVNVKPDAIKEAI